MAATCLVCSGPLRQSGGVTLYCSRGKTGCRRKRHHFARRTLAQAARDALLGGPVVYRATADQVRRFGRRK